MVGAWLGLLLSGALAAAPDNCVEWGEAELLATCEDCPLLNESSGVVPSRYRPGVWFTHNDAGGSPDLYAFDTSGVHLETHSVLGAGFRDWEDIASGPCPAGVDAETCIYIGDVGDNGSSREEVDLWVVAEPAAGASVEVVASWRLRYPVEPHDCEAIVVHPCTGRVYFITKERDGVPVVFRVPEDPTGPSMGVDLELVATLPTAWLGESGLVTGADWSAGGDRLVIRTYDGGWIWETDPAAPEAHWSTPPVEIPIDVRGQGESIAFHPDGGVLTTTEQVPMRIVHLDCATTVPAGACPPPEPEDTGRPHDTGAALETGEPPAEDSALPDEEDSASGAAAGGEDSAFGVAAASAGSAKQSTCGCRGGSGAWIFVAGLAGLCRRRRRAVGAAR